MTSKKKAPIIQFDSEGNEFLTIDEFTPFEKMDPIFNDITKLLTIIQANFDSSRSYSQLAIPFIIMISSLSISIYLLVFIIYNLIRNPIDTSVVSSQLLLITWIVQSGVSSICLISWQRTGKWKLFLQYLYSPQQGFGITSGITRLKKIVRHFYVSAVIIVIYCIGYSILAQFGMVNVPKNVVNALYYPQLVFLIQIANMYLFLSWNVAMFVYVFFTHSLYFEITQFNMNIAQIYDDSQEHLTFKIEKAINVHIQNARTVRALDNMFKRYAFLMLSTNLPTTLFSFFLLFSRRNNPWSEIIMTLPVILFCIFGFLSLTAAPAKLHDALYSTRAIFCSNKNIWLPYKNDVYQAAVALCCHLDQANLGISIWGFAIVSRPLILTTFSVMATFLALLLQFNDCRGIA